jgi:hypothetical protein
MSVWRRDLENPELGVFRPRESTKRRNRHSELGPGAPRSPDRRVPSNGRPKVALKPSLSRYLSEDSQMAVQGVLRSDHRRTPTMGSSAVCTPQNSDRGDGREAAKSLTYQKLHVEWGLGEWEIRSVLTAEF